MGWYNNVDIKHWLFKMASICLKYLCLKESGSYVMAACDMTCYCLCAMWGKHWGRRQSWALSIGHGCCGYRLWLKKHDIYVALAKGKKSSKRWSYVRDTHVHFILEYGKHLCSFITRPWMSLTSNLNHLTLKNICPYMPLCLKTFKLWHSSVNFITPISETCK
jgi:hypothetical protein